jgi:hypothetical protein
MGCQASARTEQLAATKSLLEMLIKPLERLGNRVDLVVTDCKSVEPGEAAPVNSTGMLRPSSNLNLDINSTLTRHYYCDVLYV